jgi:hypothetical protein
MKPSSAIAFVSAMLGAAIPLVASFFGLADGVVLFPAACQ